MPQKQIPLFRSYLITGNDAQNFLQGQLTCNINKLDDDNWIPGAYCQASGKTIAIFIIAKISLGYLLLCPTDIALMALARLKMFILKSDVEIKEISKPLKFINVQDKFSTPRVIIAKEAISLMIPLANKWHSPQEFTALTEEKIFIAAKIPLLSPATQNIFLPQMLGLEENHGLSYDKGCYVGQEVIARAHSKASIRRHLAIFYSQKVSTVALSGYSLLTDSGIAAATIINYVQEEDQTFVLAVVQNRYLETDLFSTNTQQKFNTLA